jgi:hypothetical protein
MQDGQNSNTRQAEAAEGLAIVESLRPRWLPPRAFPLKWEYAKKGFLAYFQRIGLGGGFDAALLVGGVRHHSRRLCELVGGLSQRLVLSGRAPAFAITGVSLFGQVSQKKKCYGMTSRSPSLTAVACSSPREL